MRSLILLGLVVATSGCSRAHLYKTAGAATHKAFATQAAPNDAPRPRGLDGEENSLIIGAAKRRLVPSAEESSRRSGAGYASSNGTGPAGPPVLMLQAK